MAKYFLTAPAFLPDGNYYEASHGAPLVINLPDNQPPSLTWAPLDTAARDALELLRQEKIELHANALLDTGKAKDAKVATKLAEKLVRPVKPCPGGSLQESAKVPAAKIKPLPKVDPNAADRNAFARLVKSQQPATTPEVTIVPTEPSPRASDIEPE